MTSPRGFTIIELLVYLGLFALLLGGVATGAFSVIESSGRTQARAMLQQEGNFLVGKINWALAGASQVTAPITTGSQLSVTKYDTTTAAINLNGTNMEIQDTVNTTATPVNNANVTVTNLLFIHTAASGDGVNQEKVVGSFTLSTHAPNGMVISQDFTTTVYLRR